MERERTPMDADLVSFVYLKKQERAYMSGGGGNKRADVSCRFVLYWLFVFFFSKKKIKIAPRFGSN